MCIFPISVWSGMACRRKRLAVLLEAVQCSYLVSEKSVRRRTSFLGNHDTFWRSSLPRRALQTRARRLAREGPSFTVRTCTTAGGQKWGTLAGAKQRLVCTSWDTYRPFRTPVTRPRNYFRNVRHLISAPVFAWFHPKPASTAPTARRANAVQGASCGPKHVQSACDGRVQQMPGRRRHARQAIASAAARAPRRRRGSAGAHRAPGAPPRALHRLRRRRPAAWATGTAAISCVASPETTTEPFSERVRQAISQWARTACMAALKSSVS